MEWIDPEWPDSLQYALHHLWSKVDELTVKNLEEQFDHTCVSKNLTHDLCEMEKKYNDLKAQVNKTVEETVSKVQLENYNAILKEEENDGAKIEAEAKVAELVEENKNLKQELEAMKVEKKKVEHALFDLLQAHNAKREKLKKIQHILDDSNVC